MQGLCCDSARQGEVSTWGPRHDEAAVGFCAADERNLAKGGVRAAGVWRVAVHLKIAYRKHELMEQVRSGLLVLNVI